MPAPSFARLVRLTDDSGLFDHAAGPPVVPRPSSVGPPSGTARHAPSRSVHPVRAAPEPSKKAPNRSDTSGQDLDHGCAARADLRRVLRATVAASPRVIDVGLGEVAFLDCTGIGELVRAYHDARDGGRVLVVTRSQGIVRMVLELTNVLPRLTPDSAAMAPGGA